MQINTVELKNIGPHKSLKVELEPGTTVVVGSNGAGKSSFVNAIYAAITGDFSRFNASTKVGVITNTSKKHEKSYVKVTGTHNGQPFELLRGLRPVENFLKIGNVEVESATAVNDKLLGSLGLTRHLVDRYVFVNQGDMFTFLDESSSVRAKTFQQLCGVDFAADIAKACSSMCDHFKLKTTVDNSLELESQLANLQEQISKIKRDIRAQNKNLLPAGNRNLLEESIQAFEHAGRLKPEIAQLKASEQSRSEEVARAQSETAELEVKFKKAEVWLTANKAALLEAQRVVSVNASQLETLNRITELKTKGRELNAKVAQAEESAVVYQARLQKFDSFDPVEAQGDLKNLGTSITSLADVLSNLTAGKKTFCDHCYQPIPEAQAAALQKEHGLKVWAYNQLNRQLDEYRVEQANLQQAQMVVARAVEARKTVASNLKMIQATLGDAIDSAVVAKAEALLATAEKATKVFSHFKPRHEAASQAYSKQQGNLQAIRNRLSAIEVELARITALCNEEEYKSYVKILEQHTQAECTIATLEEMLQTQQSNAKALSETLSRLKISLEKDAKAKHLMSIVGRAADIFHWTGLPKQVAHNNLLKLESHINEELASFNRPFLISTAADLSFNVYFSDKYSVSARQLSGGQKVILAIAFRAALDRLFGHNTGIMFLDEPAGGLDEDNVAYFHDALHEWSSRIGKNKQLVVITHEKDLNGAFDHVVQISK
jgi:exonuclease SbcC